VTAAPESSLPARLAAVPLALYVHIPWCVRKCPYCDFNSHAPRAEVDQQGYVDALLRDLDRDLDGLDRAEPGSGLVSIFIGGGTPSLFEPAAIGRLLEGLAARLDLQPDIEITLEANPGTAEANRFAGYRAAGVNRLSLGVQSLDDASLAALGRIHGAAEAREALAMARRAGFDNVNLDLMYGLPNQAIGGALQDLRALVELEPEHVSWYQLTLEPNTLFHHRPPPLPDDDLLADMADAGQALLADAGYRRYEISAYARDARRARHNLNYWGFGDYLGIGAGAHGKLSAADGVVRRSAKPRGPEAYLAGAGSGGSSRVLGPDDLVAEFFLNAMRLVDGVPAAWFPQRTGLSPERVLAAAARARALGLLAEDPARLRPTALGLRFLNDLLALFEPG
jgi:oxygen-independent coproporphyrinogen-3 oxidase